jgi:uncharacterized protein YyaL (SSP411 family)
MTLTDQMRDLFEDRDAGGFFSTAEGDSSLVMRVKEDYDGAEPSGNAVAIINLIRLSRITGNDDYRASAERALNAFSRRMAGGPTGLPQMLVALMYYTRPPKQIVLAGSRAMLEDMLSALHRRFLPFHTVLWSGSETLNRELKEMTAIGGRPSAYVCENFTCQLPTAEVSQFAELLQ